MKIWIMFLVVAMAPISGVLAQDRQALPPPPEEPPFLVDTPIALADSMLLDDAERQRLEHKALEGDFWSAMLVVDHYKTDAAYDPVKSRYWLTIAAENGDKDAQYRLGTDLRESTEADMQIRGMFWLKRAAIAGSKQAQDELRSMGILKDNKPTQPLNQK